MYFYRTKVIVKEPDSDRRLQFDLVDGNKNITTTKKKTTNSNDDMLSTILSLYQKQVLSDARSINKSSGNLDFGGKKPSNTQSQSNSNLGVCPRCQPYNSKGHRITDFNVSTRLYGNERYIQKPGYIICRSCTGTGLMSQRGPNTCNQCNGERFLKCSYCNGTGKKN
jgi:DnaJ-class molecular chaperone